MFFILNFLTQTTSTTTRRPTTTTTTTIKPRLFNYYEEGGWKILRQEEEKKKHKYDFLYHTENGIYGEEKAHLHPGAGTAASGYYEYTGDDGELYRVNYKSDHRGFVPEGDHIPTPPPVPDAIKRALEYVAKKKETHGEVQSGRYEHKSDPIRRQNMPTIDRPLTPQLPRAFAPLPTPAYSVTTQKPRAFPPLPTLARPVIPKQPVYQQPRAIPSLPPLPTLAPIANQQPRFIQYSTSNNYSPLPTIAPQNALPRTYQLPSLSSKRPDDQLIQQTQLAQQSQPDRLPQVQVPLPQILVQKPVKLEPVEPTKPAVQIAATLSTPVQLVQKTEVTLAPVKEVKATEPTPFRKIELSRQAEEEQPQSDQPQSDQPQSDQPQSDQPQSDQPQSDQPQQSELDQLPKEESISKDKEIEMKAEQSVESIVFVMPDKTEIEAVIEPASKNLESSPEASDKTEIKAEIEPVSKNLEISPEASEKEDTFQPPYQVPEELKNEDNFELTMA